MVQNEIIENSNSADEGSTIILPENPAKGIPSGKYRLVGWAIDTTGSRLIDEIVQIASYTPDSSFSQYIMPFADMNPFYSRRHGIRIVNTIRYRRLRDIHTREYLKTKSEISAMQDFMEWLEKIKGDNDGILLVYYELRKIAPGMFLEALKRYQLVDRFSKIVKGFVNGYDVSKAKCGKTTKTYSIRVMSKVLLNKESENYGNAANRARASFNIPAHLAISERQDIEAEPVNSPTGLEPQVIDFICPFANPIDAEEDEVAGFKVLLERQNTFRPVFGALMKASRQERQHASHLRRLLAENNINYDKLKQAYESGAKEGLETVIKSEIANAKEKDLEELLNILDCFFDPEKKAIEPKQKYFPNNNFNNRRRTKSFNRNKKNSSSDSHSPNASTDNPTDPVSDTTSPRSEEHEKVTDTEQVVAAQ